eukprot:10745919-Lingulodinium_polyedra.AAC.1
MRAWDGGVVPAGPRHPTLEEIENGYQELRRSLGAGLRTMAWAIAGDILEAARRGWARPDGPA